MTRRRTTSLARSAQIDYVVAQTDQRFDLFLGTFLARRQASIA